MRPSPLHNPTNKQLFTEMWNAGITKYAMASYFEFADERAIWRWVRKLGLPLRGKGWRGEIKRA